MRFLPTFNDMFDDLFHDPFQFPTVDNMRTDIIQKDNHYLLNMELPGYKKDDIQMELKDGYLIIHASTNQATEEKDKDGHVVRRERHTGSCTRSFYVGDNVKESDIKASFNNGELKVTIPENNIKQVKESRKIPIE